jgi:hypothetical protein
MPRETAESDEIRPGLVREGGVKRECGYQSSDEEEDEPSFLAPGKEKTTARQRASALLAGKATVY